MKYRLSESDYRYLWLLATPEEIKSRFKDRAHSERQIYRIYEKFNLSQIKKSKTDLIEKICLKKPIYISDEEAEKEVSKQLLEVRKSAYEIITEKILKYEEKWKN